MKKIVFKREVDEGEGANACDFLASRTHLSKARIKDAMNKGAVSLKRRGKASRKRLRRASSKVVPGDCLELYYDEKTLSVKAPYAVCMEDRHDYSIWYKPSGLLSQGTKYGDHCSILRQVELFAMPGRRAYLVHRLDREASGLMLFAHTRQAAARFSGMFKQNQVIKHYHIEVTGDLNTAEPHADISRYIDGAANQHGKGIIDLPLDGKDAVTEYKVTAYDPKTDTSIADVVIRTGRLHQIRRHLSMIGYPVIGDPVYGKDNKNTHGMRLTATRLAFVCPFTGKDIDCFLNSSNLLL